MRVDSELLLLITLLLAEESFEKALSSSDKLIFPEESILQVETLAVKNEGAIAKVQYLHHAVKNCLARRDA